MEMHTVLTIKYEIPSNHDGWTKVGQNWTVSKSNSVQFLSTFLMSPSIMLKFIPTVLRSLLSLSTKSRPLVYESIIVGVFCSRWRSVLIYMVEAILNHRTHCDIFDTWLMKVYLKILRSLEKHTFIDKPSFICPHPLQELDILKESHAP